ncbi:MAG: CoA-binding protein [Acidobacteria bacterium]|nr:MAG: CoA-binding protein [Acidobacteriota bacterium]
MPINDPEAIETMLRDAKTIAVIGISSDATRASNSVSRYMQSHGYRIIPVNPNETSVLGEKAYAQLEDVPDEIDLVDIFRRSEEAGQHVDEAISIGARAVWLQEGVIDEEAARRALASQTEALSVFGLAVLALRKVSDNIPFVVPV